MENLKLNMLGQLILESKPLGYIEVLINKNEFIVVDRNLDDQYFEQDLGYDGLYTYYLVPESEKIGDLEKHYSDPKNKNKWEQWEQTKVFSLWKLKNCILSLEKKAVDEYINVSDKCKKTDSQQMNDFLLVVMFVLENLVCQGRYEEAERMLDKMPDCPMCETNAKKCNCHE